MNVLKPLEINLNGSTLIEASAGTGKTYTITTLFLRLVLQRRVSIERILVVTFTIAATEELRIKLSERLMLAHRWLRYPDTIVASEDEILADIIKSVDATDALKLIGDAVARLDDLSVYTIDALCLRVLQDFAFESGLPLRIELIADDSEIRHEVARDYWRHVVGNGDALQVENLLALASSPDALLNTLNTILRMRDAVFIPEYSESAFKELATALKAQYQDISLCWRNSSKRIQEVFKDDVGALNRGSYRVDSKKQIIDWVKSVMSSDQLPKSLPKNDRFKLITQEWLTSKTNKNFDPPVHRFFGLCDGFEDLFNRYVKWQKIAAIIQAREFLINNLDLYKRDRGLIHFEDMRTRLDQALSSEGGERLAMKIRELWPYALIDEFQDTDLEQYRIFNTVYQGQVDCGFFMIGDPKQAVYSWRGADVFTYMAAVQEAQNRYTLLTNWRSTPAMVEAVNCLFSNRDDAFVFDQMPFRPVGASQSNERHVLNIEGADITPMQFRLVDYSEERRTDETIAMACASEIAALLNKGAAGNAVINDRQVSSADIAVLVRSHKHASMMQRALRRVGVRSVSMPNQTVFNTIEAAELLLLLEAMAFSGREGRVRSALITSLIGYDSSAMEQLLSDEIQWDKTIGVFITARELWYERGFMHALQYLMLELEVTQRLLLSPDGEQRITNLSQLGELLQVRSREVASIEELLNWLKHEIAYSTPGEESLLLRLESDEGLVQIVTMHKSKGLEYPVVYIPFPDSLKPGPSSSIVSFHDPENLRAIIDLGSNDFADHKAIQEQEKLAEDLRLLYVALTRAKSHCVMYWGDSNYVNKSALWYLIHGELDSKKKADFQQMKNDLQLLAQRSKGVIELTDIDLGIIRFEESHVTTELSLREFNTHINSRWGLNSYTGLLRGVDADLPDHDELATEDTELEVPATVTEADAQEKLISSLPAGARTGQLLHEVFEFMDFTDTANLGELMEASLQRYGHLSTMHSDKKTDWTPAILQVINNTLAADLSGNGELVLQNISPPDRLNEMEFFFTVNNLDPESLRQVISPHAKYNGVADGLNFKAFEGLMQGFIDMVVRKDQRYYIVDYKSNWLGETVEQYNQAALADSMRSHRYELQYLIYTLALHRYLAQRLPDYSYDQHFGGVFYLFVRGMRPNSNVGVWNDKPPFELIDALDKVMQSSRSAA